jgi:hypothetical protein
MKKARRRLGIGLEALALYSAQGLMPVGNGQAA